MSWCCSRRQKCHWWVNRYDSLLWKGWLCRGWRLGCVRVDGGLVPGGWVWRTWLLVERCGSQSQGNSILSSQEGKGGTRVYKRAIGEGGRMRIKMQEQKPTRRDHGDDPFLYTLRTESDDLQWSPSFVLVTVPADSPNSALPHPQRQVESESGSHRGLRRRP